jgi:hypothetical protein
MSWTERYESLRGYVLEARPLFESQPAGLAVWLAKGMAGWMRQWKTMTDPAPRSPRMVELACGSSGWQQQLTTLLAQIALTQLQVQSSP